MIRFSQLGLAEPLLRATAELGYDATTPIQAKAIPVVLAGGDLVACAQTGTGKTAAYALPMMARLIETISGRAKSDGRAHRQGDRKSPKAKAACQAPRALILSPTRELTAQIGDSLARYGKHTSLRHTVVYGGVSQGQQVTALRRGVDVLVATPGRLLDLMQQGHCDLSAVEILVLDEADQMLDMGFLPALRRIISAVPRQRQTLLFSATMPDEIRRIAQQWLTNPTAVEAVRAATPAERIAQSVHLVDANRKADLLARYLKQTPRARTLVFSRTKHGADKIVKRLMKEGLHAVAIHSNKSQNARLRALADFKSKRPPVLVATDIAARGLHVNDVSHVVNFDLPEVPETYVHRIGRTARAGQEGIAISFCAAHERELLKRIERLIQSSIAVEPPYDSFEPTEPVVTIGKSHDERRRPGRSRTGRPRTKSRSKPQGQGHARSGVAVAGPSPRQRRRRRHSSAL